MEKFDGYRKLRFSSLLKTRQSENSKKFNMKTTISSTTTLNEFRMKNFKTIVSMKKWSTRESCVFTAAFHGISLAQFWWVCGELRAKKAREKQSEVQVHMPRGSGPSPGAFSKNQFRNKGRMTDLGIFEITWKWLRFTENHQHEKVSHFS